MIEIMLDECECAMARAVGLWRVQRVIDKKLRAGHGEGGRDREKLEKRHLPAAYAEMAVAKLKRVYWGGGSENWQGPDVVNYEIRATEHSDGHAIIFETDEDSKVVLLVLVFQHLPNYGKKCRIIGTIVAKEAKQEKYTKNVKVRPESPKQYWVPQSDLDPVGVKK